MTSKPLSGPAAIAALPRNRLLGEFSLWSADLANMETDLKRIEPFVDLHHIDVADARFTPGFLFFPDFVARIAKATAKPIHVHLMVADSILISQIEQFAEAGADLISIHVENEALADDALDRLEALGLARGMVLKIETPVDQVVPYLDRLDFVTLLGTAIGVKGQGLDPQATTRLRAAGEHIARSGRPIVLAADGGIREHTVPWLRQAGANTVVLGSLAFGAPDLGQRLDWLRGL